MAEIMQTDFTYDEKELEDLKAFLDSEGISYEVFVEDEYEGSVSYKAAFCDITIGEAQKVYEWELGYFS